MPLDSVFSGVVSLRGLCMMIFLAEFNQLDRWATDISNAYLEAKTSEKVHINVVQKFEDKQGNTLILIRSVYHIWYTTYLVYCI